MLSLATLLVVAACSADNGGALRSTSPEAGREMEGSIGADDAASAPDVDGRTFDADANGPDSSDSRSDASHASADANARSDAGAFPVDAPVPDGASSVVRVTPSGACTPGGSAMFVEQCFTDNDFVALGCVLAVESTYPASDLFISEAQMATAEFANSYAYAGHGYTYLCTGTVPDLPWTCSDVFLSDCTDGSVIGGCGTLYIVGPLPLLNMYCTQ